MANTTQHPNFDKLRVMIDSNEGTYEDMRDLLRQDPMVLACHGDVVFPSSEYPRLITPALIQTVKHDNIGHTRAILEVLGNKENADKILEQYRLECRLVDECSLGHPFYATLPNESQSRGHLPHAYAKSAEMIQLLHDYGYNLNATEPDKRSSLIDKYIDVSITYIHRRIIKFVEDSLQPTEHSDPWVEFKSVLARAVKLGMNLNEKHLDGGNGRRVGAAEYAFRVVLMDLPNTQYQEFTASIIYNYFTTLASLGIDCRPIITGNMATDEYNGEKKAIAISSQLLLQKLFDRQPVYYREASTDEQRLSCVQLACAGGTFPTLLAQCTEDTAQSDDRKPMDELLSYVSPFWRKEYQLTIQTTEAMLARTSRFPDETKSGALAKYLREMKPTQRGSP